MPAAHSRRCALPGRDLPDSTTRSGLRSARRSHNIAKKLPPSHSLDIRSRCCASWQVLVLVVPLGQLDFPPHVDGPSRMSRAEVGGDSHSAEVFGRPSASDVVVAYIATSEEGRLL